MASTVAIPHFINIPGAIPGAIPGPMHGTLPPAIPITTAYNGTALPTTTVPTTLSNMPLQTMQVPVVPVGGGCYNDGMEVVWHGEFSRLFSTFYPPHVWYLTITSSPPPLKWKFHRDSAKVRFCCQDCGNGWTSMKGRVTFWFHLDYATNNGYVQFKLYGQQCKKCNSGKFEYVMWYPEEVSKVMCNVYNKVGQTYYGFLQPPIRIDRRPGRPRNQHNSDLCQACRDGECDQARPIKSLYNINGLVQAPLAVPAAPVQDGGEATTNSVTSPTPQAPTLTVVKSISNTPVPEPEVSPVATVPTSYQLQQNVITAPITLTGGLQPILTYSIMTAPPKSTSLSATSTHFVPQNPPPAGPQYYYHPNPLSLVNGSLPCLPPPPPSVQMLPIKQPMKEPPHLINSISTDVSHVINTEVTKDVAKVDLTGQDKTDTTSSLETTTGNVSTTAKDSVNQIAEKNAKSTKA